MRGLKTQFHRNLDVRTRRTIMLALEKDIRKIDNCDLVSIKYDPIIQARIKYGIRDSGEKTFSKILSIAGSLEKDLVREIKKREMNGIISRIISAKIAKRIRRLGRVKIERIIQSAPNEKERKRLKNWKEQYENKNSKIKP